MGAEAHEHYMDMAIEEAWAAAAAAEVPVGAILIDSDGNTIGRGYNHPISVYDATAHAEIVAIREACSTLTNYRLPGTTLYCTMEPCIMCAGAIIHARIARVVFGAPDPRAGACGSLYNVLTDPRLNHRVDVIRGVRDSECGALLQEFFKSRR